MKIAWLLFSRSLLAIIVFVLLYILFSLVLSAIPASAKTFPGAKDKRIYLYSNGVHLDIILPVGLIPIKLREQLQHNPDATLLGIGWGDKGFYLDTPTWAELSLVVAVKAMFLPSPTAMHVTEHLTKSANWSSVEVSQEQLDVLIDYIGQYFSLDKEGRLQEIEDAGYTPQDRFYEAEGNYSCFKTCNTWVNNAMKEIGVKTAVWTPMDKGVLRYVEE